LSKEDLFKLFYRFSRPFSKSGYERIGSYLQMQYRLQEPIPADIIKNVRENAPSFGHKIPREVWTDYTCLDYLDDAKKLDDRDVEPKVTKDITLATFRSEGEDLTKMYNHIMDTYFSDAVRVESSGVDFSESEEVHNECQDSYDTFIRENNKLFEMFDDITRKYFNNEEE
jgi:hypothetical protein